MSTGNKEFSSTLFVDAAGKQLCFRMTPCPKRAIIQPLIEKGGGFVASSVGVVADCIRLLPPGISVNSDDAISCDYILDCVGQNKLLDMSSYRSASNASNKETSGDKTILRVKSKTAGRITYTAEEDHNILKYILADKRYLKANGNQVWCKMEKLKVTSHTWSSMRTRYRKFILPNIRAYKLSPEQKRVLAKHHASKEAEISPGAVEASPTQNNNSDVGSPSSGHHRSKELNADSITKNSSKEKKPKLSNKTAPASSSDEISDNPLKVTRQSGVVKKACKEVDEPSSKVLQDEEKRHVERLKEDPLKQKKTPRQTALFDMVMTESETDEEQSNVKKMLRSRHLETVSKIDSSRAVAVRQSPRKCSMEVDHKGTVKVDEKTRTPDKRLETACDGERMVAGSSASIDVKKSRRNLASSGVDTVTTEVEVGNKKKQSRKTLAEEDPDLLEQEVKKRKAERGSSSSGSVDKPASASEVAGKTNQLQTVNETRSVEPRGQDKPLEESDSDECDRTPPAFGQQRKKASKKNKTISTDLSSAQYGGKGVGCGTAEVNPQKTGHSKTSGGEVEKDSTKVVKEKCPDKGQNSTTSVEQRVGVNTAGLVESPVVRQLRQRNAELSVGDGQGVRNAASPSTASTSKGKQKKDDILIDSSPKPVTTLIDVVMSSQAESWHTAVSAKSPSMRDLGNGEDSQTVEDDDDDGSIVQGMTPTQQEQMTSTMAKNQTRNLPVINTEAPQQSDEDDETEQPHLDEKFKSIQSIAKWLGMSDKDFVQVLCMTNGSVDDAIHWIQNGTLKSGREIWNPVVDDEKLLNSASDETHLQLVDKYGEDAVNERIQFLAALIQ